MRALGSVTAHRYLGLGGSVLLAAGAYGVGARPGQAAADALPGLAHTPGILASLAGLLVLTTAWWRIGGTMLAAPPDPGKPAITGRWMLVTAALWSAPLLFCPPLASRDVYAYACQGALVHAGLDPHAAGPASLPCPWLDSVPPIWRATASPYGPLASLVSSGVVAAAGRNLAVAVILFRLVALVGVAVGVWAGRRLALVSSVPLTSAGWLGVACPLVALHTIGGAHNDALLAGLILAASTTAAGGLTGTAAVVRACARPALVAGALLGLAAAVKITAIVVLPFIVLLVGSRLVVTGWRRLTGVAVLVTAAMAASFAGLAAASGLGVGFLRGLTHTGELAEWTSAPTAVGMTVGYLLRAMGIDDGYRVAVEVARVVGLVVAVCVIAAAAWWAGRATGEPKPRTATVDPTQPRTVPVGPSQPRTVLAGPSQSRTVAIIRRQPPTRAGGRLDPARILVGASVAVAALALLGPVFYPWYALTPLAVAAVCVDGRARVWIAVAAAILAFLILPNGVGLAPLTKLPGALGVTAAVVVIAIRLRRLGWRGARPRPTATKSAAPGRSQTQDPQSGR